MCPAIADEQIDYLEIPEKFMLCEHLRPLEAAMRNLARCGICGDAIEEGLGA